jgi:hypothetical protein
VAVAVAAGSELRDVDMKKAALMAAFFMGFRFTEASPASHLEMQRMQSRPTDLVCP